LDGGGKRKDGSAGNLLEIKSSHLDDSQFHIALDEFPESGKIGIANGRYSVLGEYENVGIEPVAHVAAFSRRRKRSTVEIDTHRSWDASV